MHLWNIINFVQIGSGTPAFCFSQKLWHFPPEVFCNCHTTSITMSLSPWQPNSSYKNIGHLIFLPQSTYQYMCTRFEYINILDVFLRAQHDVGTAIWSVSRHVEVWNKTCSCHLLSPKPSRVVALSFHTVRSLQTWCQHLLPLPNPIVAAAGLSRVPFLSCTCRGLECYRPKLSVVEMMGFAHEWAITELDG